MRNAVTRVSEPAKIPERLAAARRENGLSQGQLAERCRLQRQQINYFETGARTPSLTQLLKIARALDLPVQRFLSGYDRPGNATRDIAIELRHLGLNDLWVDSPTVPGAFRHPEEVVALALTAKAPEARILEGIPAVLAWNRWKDILLLAFAREHRGTTLFRLAWLADVALALDRIGGFPGGCPGKEDLTAFVKRVKKPAIDRWDAVGAAADDLPTSPIWRRWRISYAANLATFRKRAEGLVSLRAADGQATLARQE